MLSYIPVESMLVYGTVHLLMESRYKGIGKYIALVIIILIDTLLTNILSPVSSFLRVTVLLSVGIVMISIAYQGAVCIKIFFIILTNYIIVIIDLITCNLYSYLQNVSIYTINSDNNTFKYVLLLFAKLIDAAIIFICIYYFKKLDFNVSKKYWIIIDCITFMFLAVPELFVQINELLQFNNPINSIYIFWVAIGFLIMSILVIYFFGEISYYYDKEKQNCILSIKNQSLEQQLSVQKSTTTETLKIRHDINKNLEAISYLLQKNNLSESISYIDAITKTLSNTKVTISSGNSIIDSILNIKIALCEQQNIKIKIQVDCIPNLNISAFDICAIISNLLDNAIEANAKVDEMHRFIKTTLYSYKNYFLIAVKNPYAHKLIVESDLLRTNKHDIYRHGFGLESIKSSTEKYQGTFKYITNNGIFTAIVMLPLNIDPNQ
jgi:two-component system, LytTR family, sensor histidine kinase AgrC